jgi:hypothetical protein
MTSVSSTLTTLVAAADSLATQANVRDDARLTRAALHLLFVIRQLHAWVETEAGP